MSKIAVFDSGFGSLSIINELRKMTKSEIIYFADHKSFPYGKKSAATLRKIIQKTISTLRNEFNPDLIVVGSNTPSLLLQNYLKNQSKIITVLPTLRDAEKITKSLTIAILATKSVVESNTLKNYIKKNTTKNITVVPVNISSLVDLVESGKFISNKQFCLKKIYSLLSQIFNYNNIDVATLSSTHLSFLLPLFNKLFPQITFLDPATQVAKTVTKILRQNKLKQNKIKIFTSGNANQFHKKLCKIGIKNKVAHLRLAH
ncbi:MAG: aspartate/glutamate racemase family protein [Nitrosopumilales archaeon]|nr:aspartate/glutamate racemase family protein [Nitrosopumilales archaeon]